MYSLHTTERNNGKLCCAGVAADLYYGHAVVAFVGPGCTYSLDPTARLASYWNVPLVTGTNSFSLGG